MDTSGVGMHYFNCCLCESLNAFVVFGIGSSNLIEEEQEQDVGLVSLVLSPLITLFIYLFIPFCSLLHFYC